MAITSGDLDPTVCYLASCCHSRTRRCGNSDPISPCFQAGDGFNTWTTFRPDSRDQHVNMWTTFSREIANIQHPHLGRSKTQHFGRSLYQLPSELSPRPCSDSLQYSTDNTSTCTNKLRDTTVPLVIVSQTCVVTHERPNQFHKRSLAHAESTYTCMPGGPTTHWASSTPLILLIGRLGAPD